MKLKDKLSVKPIKKFEAKPWLLKKHYAGRVPCIVSAFGLYDGKNLIGVCTYGPPCRMLNEAIPGIPTFELNRLCVNEGLPKNSLSYFVAQTFKLLPIPSVLVSYADKNHGHHGYIYQATNWIYTGLSSVEHIYVDKNGNELHRRSANSAIGTSSSTELKKLGYRQVKQEPKFRYFMVLAAKNQKKELIGKLGFSTLPYPKGINKRYDASEEVQTQMLLF